MVAFLECVAEEKKQLLIIILDEEHFDTASRKARKDRGFCAAELGLDIQLDKI